MSSKLVINWLVPEPRPGAGGDVGLFRIIRHLAEFGHDCQVYVVGYDLMSDYSTAEVREYVQRHFGPTPAQYHRFDESVGEADATFATFWPTVENLLALPNGGDRYYLVQDFEPSFYPHEPQLYERAENTYRAGLHCITLGPWLTRLLRESYYATADHFDFAVDGENYYPQPVPPKDNQRLCFYARPATPRRAYSLGLAALEMVKQRLPEVEICFFGAEKLDPEPLFPVRQRGLLSPQEMATLFSESDVGMVFSFSNPSFVPLEMMACGCPVVEVASERWRGVLTHGREAWLVDPTPASIANGVVEVLTNRPLRERLAKNGVALTAKMSWRESARQIEQVLLRGAETVKASRKSLILPSQNFEPRRYGLGAWTEHIYLAYDLVAALKPKLLVELGTDRGESYFAFCQSALENKTGTRCVAIDHWRGDSHAGSYDETTYKDVFAHNQEYYAEFSTLLRMSFDEALDRFAPESIDLLHVDGHHTEEAVRHDLELWLPKLRPGGILLLHDIAMRGRDFGVWKVWADLVSRGRAYAFAAPPGLGLWERPPVGQLPALLATLFGPPNEDKSNLLDHYRRRCAGLQSMMARQWRDGTIRSAPMASETVVQVFWTDKESFSEEDSTDVRVGHEKWNEIAVKPPAEETINQLRIDFFSPLTAIEIAAIEVRDEVGTLVYQANSGAGFEGISLAGDCIRRSVAPFVIEVTGPDPQLHLPWLARQVSGLSVYLQLRVQTQL